MGWLGDAFGWVWDHTLGPVVEGAAGFVWDQIIGGIVGWIVDAVAWFVGRVLSLLEETTRVNLRAGWFLDPGGPYRTVLAIAAVLLVGFVFLGLLQGLLAGDPMAMLSRVVRDLPLAVLGMVCTIAIGSKLLELSDALSRGVLRGGGDNSKEVLRVMSHSESFAGQTSFVIAVLGLLVIIAALFVWVELVIRSALIYLLIAFSPLVLAAMVWPTARGMVRKFAELAVALIFSKVVIAIAFSVGAAALSGIGNTGHANAGEELTASAGTLFSGLVIFCLAAFAPFVLLKLFPAAEAAVVAQGVSRGPLRTTQQVSASAFYLERLAGRGHAPATNGSSNGAHSASRDFGSGPAGGSPSGPAAGPGPGSAPSGAGAGSSAAGGGGPAAVALAGADVARRVRDRTSASAAGAVDAASRHSGSDPEGREA